MPKTMNIFNDYYDVQESWIFRQLKDLKKDSFVDFSLTQKYFENAGLVIFVNNKSVDQFREKHLSEIGKNKLSATLRTYKKREKRRLTTKRLDIDISRDAYIALESLVNGSGLTKIQYIENLILKEREYSHK